MFGGVIVFGCATIAFGLSHNIVVSLIALAVLGASDVVSVVVRTSLVQLRTPDETLLCVANLAATARSAVVQVGHAGASLTDVFGGARFPRVADDGTVTMTWGSRDFYWHVVGGPDDDD